MRVMGVDPGLTRCGLALIETAPGRAVTALDVDVVRTTADEPLERRWLEQGVRLDEVVPRGDVQRDRAIGVFGRQGDEAAVVHRILAIHDRASGEDPRTEQRAAVDRARRDDGAQHVGRADSPRLAPRAT